VKLFAALEIVGSIHIGDLTKLVMRLASGWIAGSTCNAEDLEKVISRVPRRLLARRTRFQSVL
jgi:hypothetical protein